MATLGLACPGGHQIDRQRPAVSGSPDMPGEAGQTVPHRSELEADTAPLGQVLLDPGLQADPGTHAGLPGHGSNGKRLTSPYSQDR